jgi:hypothetical protein
MAAIFARFTITRAKLITIPTTGFLVAFPSYRNPLAIGYFNDGVAVANPTSYNTVLSDE